MNPGSATWTGLRPPGPSTRHRSHLRQSLTLIHLATLSLVSIYLTSAYPNGTGPVLFLLCAGIIAELAPIDWRRYFVPELLLLISGAASYAWVRSIDANHSGSTGLADPSFAFNAWVRMTIAFWALIPSRIGMMRVISGLALGEALILATRDDSQLILTIGLGAAILAALGAETWLRGLCRGEGDVQVGQTPRPSIAQSLLPLCVLTAVIGVGGGSGILTWAGHLPMINGLNNTNSDNSGNNGNSTDLSTSIGLGDDVFTDQNPLLVARLDLQDDLDLRTQVVYLRAVTTPYLASESRTRWYSRAIPRQQHNQTVEIHSGHSRRWALLFRQRGGGDTKDMVLRPDHSAAVEIPQVLSDDDGNLYRRGLGEHPRRYLVELGAARSPAEGLTPEQSQRYLDLTDAVREVVTRQIPDIDRWRGLPPEIAAESIASWLQARCSYALRDLPPPAPGAAGDLRTFLFGTPQERRGHCQYFTTAAVVLLRASGHPARPVVGYASNEIDNRGATIRALHAHAWAEVLTADGWWQRLDATPPHHLSERAFGVELGDEQPLESIAIDAEEDPEATASTWWWWLVAIAICGLVIAAGATLAQRQRHGSPLQRQLARATDALIRCAMDCGVRIDVSTTLGKIAEALEQRTGVDLSEILRAHQAARFGAGPPPPPWPVQQLRRAWRERQRHTAIHDQPPLPPATHPPEAASKSTRRRP